MKSRYEFNDNFKDALKELNDEGAINLEEWKKITIRGKKGKNEKEEAEEMETSKKQIKDKIIEFLKANHNLILTGAPGTGKTYLARQVAKVLVGQDPDSEENSEYIGFCQFHPSFDYTDFVEGLRPVMSEGTTNQIGFKRQDGIFKALCKKALQHENKDQKFVFIIDEINRGDISKIFGELFFAIDPGYRGIKGKIKTQYSNLIDVNDQFKDGFYVPENVYIIGTMNDIDRSVESMDFAIRRRFVWFKIQPTDQVTMLYYSDSNKKGLEKETADVAKKVMNALNEKIRENEYLGEDYQIGAAYFLKLKELDFDYNQLWTMNLEPLLRDLCEDCRKRK